MGYELLNGNTAFPPGLPRGTIRRMLHGKAPLPWEDHANSSELTDELADNEIKGIVLSCLARDPTVRPPATALAATFEKLLAAAAPPAAAPEDAADSVEVSRESAEFSGSFFRAPLISRTHDEASSAVVPRLSDAAGWKEQGPHGDGALRVGPAGLAVSAKRSGSDEGEAALEGCPSASVVDTLDNTGSFKELVSREGTHLASGELRSELSVTAAMW